MPASVDPMLDPLVVDGRRFAPGFLAGQLMAGVRNFCASGDERISPRHLPAINVSVDDLQNQTFTRAVRDALNEPLQDAWRDLESLDTEEVDRYIAQTRAMLDPPDIVPLPALAARVSEKEAALQQSYARVEQLAREQERTSERARSRELAQQAAASDTGDRAPLAATPTPEEGDAR